MKLSKNPSMRAGFSSTLHSQKSKCFTTCLVLSLVIISSCWFGRLASKRHGVDLM